MSIIPEYQKSNPTLTFDQILDKDSFTKIRQAQTEKALAILVTAEWDESSQLLKQMTEEMPSSYPRVNLKWFDCDAVPDLVDQFEVDQVPALVLFHPHKNQPEITQPVTPEQLSEIVSTQNNFYAQLFEQERQKAFRDIDVLVKQSPCFMFIKGTLDQPKCKFTRKLVDTLKPMRIRNIKTFNILEDERIRQWLKFYSKWPTFPQVFCDQQFVGGIDVVMELIEEGEFMDTLPKDCHPLNPQQELDEIIKTNKMVLIFKKTEDVEQYEEALKKANAISYAVIDLTKMTHLAGIVQDTSLYLNGEKQEDAVATIEKLVADLPKELVKETLDEKLKRIINQDKIMLFMKGDRGNPQCGFSSRMIKLLEGYKGSVISDYSTFDILSDNEVREGLKKYSNWPTFPQLYVNGALVGGIDIAEELHQEGELEDALTN